MKAMRSEFIRVIASEFYGGIARAHAPSTLAYAGFRLRGLARQWLASTSSVRGPVEGLVFHASAQRIGVDRRTPRLALGPD